MYTAVLLVKSHPVTVAVPELYIAPPYNDIYPSSVNSFVGSFVHASVIISQERKKMKGVSQGAQQRLDRDNERKQKQSKPRPREDE